MAVTANMPRLARKGLPALIAALTVLLSISSLTATAAQAETKGEGRASTAGAEARDWNPTLTPIRSPETVRRNLSTAQRNAALNNCPSGFVCVAAGEGDGQHTVYTLYYCTQRTLSNFIDAGAVNNNQTGGAVVTLKRRNGSTARSIGATGDPVRVDWLPIWYLDPC